MSTKTYPNTMDLIRQPATQPSTTCAKMEVQRYRFRDLPASILQQWRVWQGQPEFYSPYFHPEFAACVDRVRDDAYVATASCEGQLSAILPYQLIQKKTAEPIGGAVNDYHGIICDSRNPVSASQLIREVGLSRFQFHSWLQPNSSIDTHAYDQVIATVAEFESGFETFHKELCRKSSTIKRHPQKSRKLSREIGPIRLELHSDDSKVLDWVIEMKRKKYHRTGVVDFFGVEWTRNLLHEIQRTQTDDFGGMLSALYAGDRLVAAHFGMRCNSTLHYWYPVYDPTVANYSPGTEMFLQIARQAAERGFDRIDFGYGDDAYKEKLTNREFKVARGCVDFNRLRSTCNRRVDQIVSKVKSSPAKQPLKKLIRLFMPNAGQPRV